MKRLHRLLLTAVALATVPANTPVRAQTLIGFIEKFALATDREDAMKELIPGTEEYYFFHALHLQNSRRTADLDALLSQWAKRSADSPLLREIRNRETLLTYDTTPQATLDYLKHALDLSFDQQQDTLHPRPNLPTALDPNEIAPKFFVAQALHDPFALDNSRVTDLGIDYLLTSKASLTEQQRRVLLQRVTRPDTPHLVETLLADFNRKGSRGFGEYDIERKLLTEQYQELAKARPALMKNTLFVESWMARLRPGADTDIEHDAKAREAWLDGLWAFARNLDPSFNSLKAHILYQRLRHDEKLGAQNKERFIEYLKLPRSGSHINPQYRDLYTDLFRHPANLHEDFSIITGHPPIVDDEPLVRRYLLHFLRSDPAKNPDTTDYSPYVEIHFLKGIFAEAKLLAGKGDAETLFSMLTPSEVQALRERVEIEFDPANPDSFAPDATVNLALWIKNVPHLAVNIFEINTENFYRTRQRQIGTDLDLDGLVANQHLGFDYLEAPVLSVKRSFKLADLPARRGVWVVDFIGNGRSSRALIRKGQLHCITRASSAGTALTVLDENSVPLPKAYALIGGQRFEANKNNEIVIPFSSASGEPAVVLGDGTGFTQLEEISLLPENYSLAAGFHVPRESLLSGKKATVALRPTLSMNDGPVDLRLLKEVKLTIRSATYDGVSSSIVKTDLKLSRDSETTVEFSVPDRLASLQFTLEGKVRNLASGQMTPLSVGTSIALNQKDNTDATSDLFLSNVGSDFILQELGRSGEPRSERALNVKFWRPEFAQPVEVELKTDANGSVHLGPLHGILGIEVRNPSGASRSWILPVDRNSGSGNIHIAAGHAVVLPWLEGDARPVPPMVSLIEVRDGLNVRSLTDDKHVGLSGNFLVINHLDPGDYSLRYGSDRREINIRVTKGTEIAGWILGDARHLQARSSVPLQIGAVSLGKDTLTVLLDNATPDTRVHVLASRFLPPFDAFKDLGPVHRQEPLIGTPDQTHSLFISGRTLGEEYRYVMERRGAKKYPGVMLPRPGLLLNPWALRTTQTALNEARLGDQFGRSKDGNAATSAVVPPPSPPVMQALANSPVFATLFKSGDEVADVDFLANAGLTDWNLKPDQNGRITLKLADLGDRQFIRVLAINGDQSIVRDLSLADAKTKLRDLTLPNGLDPNGHFTRQNQTTLLEKDAPFTIKDAATAQFEGEGSLGNVFDLFRTLSNNPTLPQFSFILEWPKLSAARKQSLYSRYACHELNFFLQRRDPAFFKSVIQPFLANKRDKTFMDHYLLGDDLRPYLDPWKYGRLNVVERILLAQRHAEEAAATSREMSELQALLPPNTERDIFLFDSALEGSKLAFGGTGNLGVVRALVKTGAGTLTLTAGNVRGVPISPNSIDGLIIGGTPDTSSGGVLPPPARPAADPFAAAQSPGHARSGSHLQLGNSYQNKTDFGTYSGVRKESESVERAKARYYDAARDQNRAKMLNMVNSGWEDQVAVAFDDGGRNSANSGRYYTQKMQRIIFPAVQFNGVSVEQAIEFLRVKSKDLDTTERDPSKRGVNIILKPGSTPSTAQISLDLHDVPMIEALRYVTDLAGMKYKVESFAVVVMPITEVGNEQYTRTFKVPKDFLKRASRELNQGNNNNATAVPPKMTAMQILQSAGVTFPEGASATFNVPTSQLVVKNTQPNLDAVDTFVESIGGEASGQAVERDMERDADLRAEPTDQFYVMLEPTSEFAEENYYHLPIEEQGAGLITINRFWKDYATWDGKGGFLSPHVAEASQSFPEMMFALSVLDLPFPSDAKAPKTEVKDLSLTITPTQRMILFHRELKPAEMDKAAPRLLVSQNFYRYGDRYILQEGEKLDKFVTEEFLTGIVYGCQVVVTNPTSSTQKLDLLLQIPQGSIAVLGSKPTDNRPLTLEPYRTFTSDYYFYFPRAGKFGHHPVHVSKAEKIVAFAPPFTFNVVNELTKLDTASWDYVSQFGKAEDVLSFLEQHNIQQVDLKRMAWRLKDADFFRKAIALLKKHHVFDMTIWSYAVLHNDTDALREYLQSENSFVNECGPALESRLLTIDPVARLSYQHLEYDPLVNARAHQLGGERTLLNGNFHTQYASLLEVLAHRPSLSDEDRLAVSYYLFLQDRIEEALATFASVDAAKITEHLQYDYLKAVAALYQGDAATARQIAQTHVDLPVERWKDKFAEMLAQLGEIEGKKPAAAKPDNREQVQNKLASSEPTLDFAVENKEVKLAYHNVKEVTVNYYPMDLEFLFSSAPFVSQNSNRFGMIQPNKTERLQLPADHETHSFALPHEYDSSNVLVEIEAAGKTTSHAYYANELNVQISENYGRLQVLHAKDNRPLPRTYVKVFAAIDGHAKFYKDGYTDLRGKFDYLSLSTPELTEVTRLSILILSDEFGAAVREVKPPRQ